MKFQTVIENISTINDLKRIANAYVIDYRALNKEELIAAIIKTSPQYYFKDNVQKSLNDCLFSSNRDVRTLTPIILKQILLNKDDFKVETKKLNEEIIKFEQAIVNKSNEFSISQNHPRKADIDLFSFVLETAWESEDTISKDEKNLIVKLQHKLGISETEYIIIESKLGKFPKNKNILHSHEEINEVKRELQRLGLLFTIRDDDGIDLDIIPSELVNTLRDIYGIEIKKQGYLELIKNKRVKSKSFLISALNKAEINLSANLKLEEIQEMIINNIKPSILLGGYTSRDGLSNDDIIDWLKDLSISSSGTKDLRISKLIEYYDTYKEKNLVSLDDERISWVDNYELLAARKLDELRAKHIISKDLECEKKFEKATEYIFDVMLNRPPLDLIGSEHPDGVLSFNDKLIMWDNKSKEREVNLKDHIGQFERYIKSSEKDVTSFLVIGPSFTPESVEEAMKFQLLNDTVITLITAKDLKTVALKWSSSKKDDPFPLGYFKQPGKFNPKLISY
jgi:hypothetical protein